jgi:heat shock protein HtpX
MVITKKGWEVEVDIGNHRFANLFQTFMLIAAMTVLFIVAGYLIGGSTGLIIALVASVVSNLMAWYSSGTMAIRATQAQPVSRDQAPELYAIVDDLAERADIPKPEVYIIPSEVPNAFATGRNPHDGKVAVTEGIMRLLNRDELAGVLAHEFAHVKYYDILTSSIAGALAGAVAYLANMARFSMYTSQYSSARRSRGMNIGALLAIFLAPVAAMIIRFAVSRSREFGADEGGALLLGNPVPLANALQKLENMAQQQPDPLLSNPAISHLFIVTPALGSLSNLFRTHPPTEERVARLMQMAREMNSPSAVRS